MPEELLAGGFGFAIMIFLLVVAILIFLMPFFIHGTSKRTRETSEKLAVTNRLLEEIRDALKK